MKYNNIIFLGLCLGLTTYSALSADSVIKISGRVLDYGCTVSSDSLNFTVDLQKNSARQFPTTGSTSPAVPFQITLSECSKGTTGVRVAFNGIEDAENNTLLKLDEGSNTASGLGIEILDANMRPVKLNDLHAGMQWITGTRTEQYFALLRSSEVNSEVRQSGTGEGFGNLYP